MLGTPGTGPGQSRHPGVGGSRAGGVWLPTQGCVPRATLAAVARPRCPARVASWQGGGAEAPGSVHGAGGETLGLGFPFSETRPANAHACFLRNSRLGCLLVGPAAPSLPAPGTGQAANSPLSVPITPRGRVLALRLAPPAPSSPPSLEAVWVFAAPPTRAVDAPPVAVPDQRALGRFPSPLGAAWCQGRPAWPPAETLFPAHFVPNPGKGVGWG